MTALAAPARAAEFLIGVGRRRLVNDDPQVAKGCDQVGQILVGLVDDLLRKAPADPFPFGGREPGVVVEPGRDVGLRRDPRASGIPDDDLPKRGELVPGVHRLQLVLLRARRRWLDDGVGCGLRAWQDYHVMCSRRLHVRLRLLVSYALAPATKSQG